MVIQTHNQAQKNTNKKNMAFCVERQKQSEREKITYRRNETNQRTNKHLHRHHQQQQRHRGIEKKANYDLFVVDGDADADVL